MHSAGLLLCVCLLSGPLVGITVSVLMVVRLLGSHAQMFGLEFTMLSLMCGVMIYSPPIPIKPRLMCFQNRWTHAYLPHKKI